MNTKNRFLMASLILVCLVSLGLSQGAWAGPLSFGTVPDCPTSAIINTEGKLTTCSSVVDVRWNIPTGGYARLSEINAYQYGKAPEGRHFVAGVALEIFDQDDTPMKFALVEVCFPDPSGMKTIYRWMTSSEFLAWYNSVEDGRWVLSPTYFKTGGLTCTQTWRTGIYTIVY